MLFPRADAVSFQFGGSWAEEATQEWDWIFAGPHSCRLRSAKSPRRGEPQFQGYSQARKLSPPQSESGRGIRCEEVLVEYPVDFAWQNDVQVHEICRPRRGVLETCWTVVHRHNMTEQRSVVLKQTIKSQAEAIGCSSISQHTCILVVVGLVQSNKTARFQNTQEKAIF